MLFLYTAIKAKMWMRRKYLSLHLGYMVHTGQELPAQGSQKIDTYVPILAFFVHGYQKKRLVYGPWLSRVVY